MNKKIKYLLLMPLTAIVSCGYSSSYLIEGDKYVSSNFKENYYTHWDDELKAIKPVKEIDVTDKQIIAEMNYGYEPSLLNGIEEIDPNFFDKAPDVDEYGEQFKMNDLDDSFKYGYQSKLFDGQMVCGGQNNRPEYAQAKGRVQIGESGISIRFSKESSDLHYFALQFKASTDNTRPAYKEDGNPANNDYDLMHESKIRIKTIIYTKTLTQIEAYSFISDVELIGTVRQAGVDRYKTNNGHVYNFLAFDLEQYELSRCVGVSIQFEVVEDALLTKNKELGNDMTYALFLYEIFFPYTSWN